MIRFADRAVVERGSRYFDIVTHDPADSEPPH